MFVDIESCTEIVSSVNCHGVSNDTVLLEFDYFLVLIVISV